MRRSDEDGLRLRWSSRLSLRQRIFAINIFALALLAGSLFYLDGFRARLSEARMDQAMTEARLIARLIAAARPEERQALLIDVGRDSGERLRVYGPGGALLHDSWDGAPPTYELRDPAEDPLVRDLARFLDNALDAVIGARRPPLLGEPVPDRGQAWPELGEALATGAPAARLRRAPEGTPFVSAAAPVPGAGTTALLLTTNAREIRRVVRAERLSLGIILAAAIALSALLSLFLARTIANPLRSLALAAHRVRLGRARDVTLPLLPERRDEIGLLARALHDMTEALRNRIDATEAFAADVTHELKNPLASLRSAVDSLDRIEDPALRCRLLDVVRQDVVRLDRLVVDIAETSRLDAELSRARFEPVDMGRLIEAMLPLWEERAEARGVRLAFARPRAGSAVMAGDESRLARLIDNLVDNAISFSPPGALVEIGAVGGESLVLTVEDEGPGVPEEAREAIFNRFHSIRPEEDFGRHSGLGLAIGRAIVEGHGGQIHVEDRHDGRSGARFVVRFPGAGA